MTRFLMTLALVLWGQGAVAQSFTALARIDPERSEATDAGTLRLGISQPVPYRLALWSDPVRLVVDFRTVAFERLPQGAYADADWITGHRTGSIEGGWSRLVVDLAGPMVIAKAGMVTETTDGSALVEIRLEGTDAATFQSAAQPGAVAREIVDVSATAPFTVALDPGHGGTDPGAVRADVAEADLMLTFARELRDLLRRSGAAEVVLTRDGDHFVSLEGRIARAKQAGADVFVSLHADALAKGTARGAQIYTLSERASSAATAQLAARHDRSDLLAGVDLSAQDDPVARVLMSLARRDTQPRAAALADRLVAGLTLAGVAMHPRPQEEARFSVLKSADMPSVLIELGFLSTPSELANLQSEPWRAKATEGIAGALLSWWSEDAARR